MSVRRRRRIPVIVPIASMGDIAFLLIIFFMLTSNMIQEAHVRVNPARAIELSEVKAGTVTVSMDEDGKLWLQGQPVVAAALEYEVAALLTGRDDKLVVLKVDRDLPQSKYGSILMSLSKAGAKIGLVGEEKKP